MKHQLTKKESNKLFKQKLQRVHVATGISFSLLMYIAVFFGIFSILLPYIQVWEKPSRHFESPNLSNINYSAMIEPILKDPDYPKINGVTINLPGYHKDPAVSVFAPFTEMIVFNPNTTERVKSEDRFEQLSRFLRDLHYGRPLKLFGLIVFGLMAVAGMFLVIGGVLQVILIKYKDKAKNATGKFSKWHRKLFIWIFPPFIIITLTGAFLNIGFISSPPMTYLASKGEAVNVFKLVRPILFPKDPIIKQEHIKTPMLTINELLKKAQKINPEITYQRIKLFNWGDKTARAKLDGYNPYKPFLNGISNRPSVTLSGADGSLISQQKVLDKNWAGLVYDSVFFLHLLFGVDTFTRIIISIIMLVSTFALGFGVLLYLEKKAKKFPKDVPVYNWMGKLSLATMIGVIPATGILFVLQWILPFDMQDRFIWQKGIFFVTWIGTLTWAFYRINSYKAAKEFLSLGGILFLIAPLIHFYNSGFTPMKLFNNGMTEILSVDIGLFIFGAILLFAGAKLPHNREKIQHFWSKKI